MKKTVAFVVAVVMLFGCLTVQGAVADDLFDALFNPVYSGKMHMQLSSEAKSIPQILKSSELFESIGMVDFELLAESLLKSKADISGTYNVSKDMKKAKYAMTYEIDSPININDNFRIQANSKWSFWIDYDLTLENPVYKIIYKTPLNKKYVVMDISEAGDFSEVESSLPTDEELLKITKDVSNLYKTYGKISKQGNGYKITFDDNGIKLFIGAMFDMICEMSQTQLLAFEASPSEIRDFQTGVEDMKETFSLASQNFEVLGKGGFVINLSANKGGYITAENLSLDLKLNIYDILNAFGIYNSTSGITKENSEFEAVFNAKAELSSHNRNVSVEFPVLTEENSVDMFGDMGQGYENFEDLADVEHRWFSLEEEGLPVIYDGYPMVDLEEMCKSIGFDFAFENGVATVDTKTSLGIFEFEDGEKTAKNENGNQDLKRAAKESEGKIFIGIDDVAVLSVEISNISYYSDGNSTYTYGYFENPDFVEPEEEIWQTTEENFSTAVVENVPLFKEGDAIYFPVAPFLGEFNVGTEEITAKDGVLVVESPKAFGFSRLKLFENSVYVEKDGESILLKNPVRYNNSFYVSTDFAEIFGFELNSIDIYGWNDGKGCVTFYKELN